MSTTSQEHVSLPQVRHLLELLEQQGIDRHRFERLRPFLPPLFEAARRWRVPDLQKFRDSLGLLPTLTYECELGELGVSRLIQLLRAEGLEIDPQTQLQIAKCVLPEPWERRTSKITYEILAFNTEIRRLHIAAVLARRSRRLPYIDEALEFARRFPDVQRREFVLVWVAGKDYGVGKEFGLGGGVKADKTESRDFRLTNQSGVVHVDAHLLTVHGLPRDSHR